ncbi:MAG: 4Fe-4S dicluster domain-containing protein [Anaerolineae bacterium]|nr:4Fe-4S dicluster domain-containing protein [Anaerolineae bacterium]
MSTLDQEIRDRIVAWLAEGEIDVFIGYERGPLPLRATPLFVREPADVECLIWDATCENNLAAFLKQLAGQKVGLFVKGCDARALVGLMQEGQIRRENLRIVGAHCAGVIDPRRVAQAWGASLEDLDDADIQGRALPGEGVIVLGERQLPIENALYAMCRTCTMHAPVLADVEIGDQVDAPPLGDSFAHVREMEALDADARWARFSQEVARCNLCFACRNACPLCYCRVCFADQSQPRWFTSSTRPSDLQFYQIMRTFHLAGRCVGCGACTRACPQGIDIRLFLDKLRKDVAELYDYEAGLNPDEQPPLRTYRQDDYDDFVL